jgi:hypothetical protein
MRFSYFGHHDQEYINNLQKILKKIYVYNDDKFYVIKRFKNFDILYS